MAFEKLKEAFEGQIFTDEETLAEVQTDFGGLVASSPAAVAVPSSTKDVCTLIKTAAAEGWAVTTRGMSHSQSGQSLSQGGILLDMGPLNRIERIGRHSAWVQAGVLWSDLLRASIEENLVPPVFPSYLDITVGGTISVGGLGASSFKRGHVVLHVEELEVITGEGHTARCSPDENAALFNCTRAGLGQFSVVTRAKVHLRACAPQVRTFFLLYDNLPALMRDCELLMIEERFDYLEAFAVPCPLGFKSMGETKIQFADWFYLLQVSVEHGHTSPHDDRLLDGLRFYRKTHVEDSGILGFATRHEALYSLWRETGTWSLTHPWIETVLPWRSAAPFIQGVLRSLPPNLLIGGQVILGPLPQQSSQLPMLLLPEGEKMVHFGLLPAVPRQLLPLVLPMLMKASELSIEMGGKRYLSGWINFDQKQWKNHFGERWGSLVEWKRFYDPKGILNPGFIKIQN